MKERLMSRGKPFQTVGGRIAKDLLPNSVENWGQSRKIS